MKKIAFIDLEASSLGSASWPIEAGFCYVDGRPKAWLIRPAQEWSLEAWDEKAEALHGLDFETLNKSGQPAEDVCHHLNEGLKDAKVYSDAPDWDGFWLYRLFSAAGVRQAFKLHEFGELLAGVDAAIKTTAIKQATEAAPHRHRACDDVLHMQTIFKFITAADKR